MTLSLTCYNLHIMKCAVIGAGSWGTMLSILLGRNEFDVYLVGRSNDLIQNINQKRENIQYLPGFVIPSSVNALTYEELGSLKDQIERWIMVVPTQAVREVSSKIDLNNKDVLVGSKGIESSTGKLISDILKETAPKARLAYLGGPNLAIEVAQGMPTISLIASEDIQLANQFSTMLWSSYFKVYTSTDVIGIELAGALKNVLAIGAGISDGLGYGQNSKAALMTRGLSEIIKLGLHLGAKIETFVGAAGIGDLFVSAQSQLSRNYRIGLSIAKGTNIYEAMNQLGQVAEGVHTSQAVMKIAYKEQIKMPIFDLIYQVIYENLELSKAMRILMEGLPRLENNWLTEAIKSNADR